MIIYTYPDRGVIRQETHHFLAECVSKISLVTAEDWVVSAIIKGLDETQNDVVVNAKPRS